MKTWVVSIETKRYGAVLYRPYFLNDRFILIARQRPLIFGKYHEDNLILFT